MLLSALLLVIAGTASLCSEDVTILETLERSSEYLKPLKFDVGQGGGGIKAAVGTAADGINEGTPATVKALGLSVSCDGLNYIAENGSIPPIGKVEGWIGADVLYDVAGLTQDEKFNLAWQLQRIWAQALVNNNDQITQDEVNEASDSLACSGVAG